MVGMSPKTVVSSPFSVEDWGASTLVTVVVCSAGGSLLFLAGDGEESTLVVVMV